MSNHAWLQMIQDYVPPQMWKAWEVASTYTKDHTRAEMVESIQGVMNNAWMSLSSKISTISTTITTTISNIQHQQQLRDCTTANTSHAHTTTTTTTIPQEFGVSVQPL